MGLIPEQDRLAGSQAEILFLVLLSEVILLYVHHSRERHLVGCVAARERKNLQQWSAFTHMH